MVAEMVGTVLMLQAVLLGLLASEVIFYAWLGNFLGERGVSGLAITASLLLMALLWRLSHALISFLITAALRWRDDRALPWANSMAALTSEIIARAICFNWSQAFPQIALGDDPCGARSGTPILLVHGYLSNRGLWITFRRRLAAAGLGPIYTLTLTPVFGAIDALVPSLDARVEAICAETGAAGLMIVAHSMGGLVVRSYLAQFRSSRVVRLVTLGSPHHGTQQARWGLGINVGQMRVASNWLQALAVRESGAAASTPPPNTLSIYTLNDDLVYPPESSVLAWAENLPVSAIGHMGLVFSDSVANSVIRHLR